MQNVVVAQSGGPSPVINSSLLGVIEGCRAFPNTFGRIFGACHGIEGVLTEKLINLSDQPEAELALLDTTPGAGAIGTCRYKIGEAQDDDLLRTLDVFAAHRVGYFFYIGGNDSMDTAARLTRAATDRGQPLVCIGIPKTIDNDVGDPEFALVDHTPGYGSVARYWACVTQNMNEENAGFAPAGPVLVMQAMGRTAGFIPAAARLADPERRWPMQLYLAEANISLEEMADRINDMLRARGRCLVVVSEGFDVGDLGARRDAFGHIEYAASSRSVQQQVVNFLHARGLPVHGWAHGQMPGCDQRTNAVYASTVDRREAREVARHGVQLAAGGKAGVMAAIQRAAESDYRAVYGDVKLEAVANFARQLPAAWLSENRVDVTDDFVRYARPLIGEDWAPVPIEDGLQRFARLSPDFVEPRCAAYVPAAHRPGTTSAKPSPIKS